MTRMITGGKPAGKHTADLIYTLAAVLSHFAFRPTLVLMPLPPPPRTTAELRAKYRSLVWSNPDGASDETYRLAALRRGNFVELLDFACIFGVEQLRSTWTTLQTAEPLAAQKICPVIERILRNLQTAADLLAQTRHSEVVGTAAQ